jgi:hypothetical protein
MLHTVAYVDRLAKCAGERIVLKEGQTCFLFAMSMNLNETEEPARSTLCTFPLSTIEGEIQGLAALMSQPGAESRPYTEWWDCLRQRMMWPPTRTPYDSPAAQQTAALPEALGIPAEVRTAIDTTIGLLWETIRGTIGQPRKEIDPEVENYWWIAIPVRCEGTVDEVLASYNAFAARFVETVAPELRERIRVDLQTQD